MSSKADVLKKEIALPDGRSVSIETGHVAKQADGSIILRMDNAMLLATVVSAREVKEGMNFLPLTVNYQEQYAAAGRFPGGFFKREGRPSSYEIVISRLIDRALRPLFPEDYRAETQILISLISADKNVMPDCLAGLAASAALTLSDIPFSGPISEVRVARINGEFVVNPYIDQLNEADMDIIVAGTEEEINMVEGEMDEASEADMVEALKYAHEAIKSQCQALKAFEQEAGTTEKRTYEGAEEDDEALKKEVDEYFRDRIYEIAKQPTSKPERSEAFDKLFKDYLESLDEEKLERKEEIKAYFGEVKKDVVRNMILHDRKRLDGRALDEVRPIDIEIDFLPSAHGSALFTRGETQSLTSVTLGSRLDKQMVDEVMFESYEKFILHYNFPPFSTGEAKMLRGPGRREIGHGHLAQRSLEKVLPPSEENPYTVRVVSDILESNGSSSMATVCAGSLALMDAGIKTRKPVSGIAMGLINDDKGNYGILSDILGDEDHLGDMDFKVSGTQDGITACQMDLKVEGLSYDMLQEALNQAKDGRLHILDKMNETIGQARDEFKPNAPRIEKLYIGKEFIGTVIGPGGKNITKTQEETGTEISVDQDDERGQGIVEIMADNKEQLEAAKERIQKLIEVPEEGKVYTGKVESIQPFGAIIEFLPGKTGLLHISEIAWERTESVEDVMKEGQEIDIKLKSIDEKSGRFSLTRKELLEKPEGYKEPERNGKGDKFSKKGPPKGGPRKD